MRLMFGICLSSIFIVSLSAFGGGYVSATRWGGEWSYSDGGPVVVTSSVVGNVRTDYYWCCKGTEITGFDVCVSDDDAIYVPGVYRETWTGDSPPQTAIVGYNMGSECLIVPSSVNGASITGIGLYAFYNIPKLTGVFLPETVTRIGSSAFKYCRDLIGLEIPRAVTRIGSSAFYGCSSLVQINISKNVETIGDEAFEGCNKLEMVFVDAGDVERVSSMMANAGCNISQVNFVEKGPGTESTPWIVGDAVTAFIKTGTLYVRGTGSVLSTPWTARAAEIVKAEIETTVTDMPAAAFSRLPNLMSVNGLAVSVFNAVAAGVLVPATVETVELKDGQLELTIGAKMTGDLCNPQWTEGAFKSATVENGKIRASIGTDCSQGFVRLASGRLSSSASSTAKAR